jgi:outer membrane receptor protein involved in Fe transport
MEQYNQKVNSFADDGTPIIVDNTVTDFLPSANLVYSLTEKSNLRAAYYKTVSRPEYRELAPFGFFDFSTFFTVRGNPNLQRAIIQNYDIRYEWFGTFNQLLSASVFYKNFTGAIEQVSVPSESRTIDYQNINKATNYGIELEARVNAAAITKKYENKYLASLSAFCNVSLIKSRVDLSDVKDAGAASRPLQGQSPYIINTGLQYYDSEKSQGISISLNKIGRRIYLVGNLAEPSIWENPRTVIDAQISKTFFKRLEVKFNVKDVLANNFLFYQDINNDGKYNKDLDNLMTNIYSGRSFSLSINYKFK